MTGMFQHLHDLCTEIEDSPPQAITNPYQNRLACWAAIRAFRLLQHRDMATISFGRNVAFLLMHCGDQETFFHSTVVLYSPSKSALPARNVADARCTLHVM